ncbi:hypothetical protein GGI35DRAFT_40210 [Trichoderma velutinum]
MWIDAHVEATHPSSARLTASDPPCCVCVLLCLSCLSFSLARIAVRCSRELDLGSTGKTGASIPMFQPVYRSSNSCNQPEQRTGQVYPHGVLHAFDISVAMGVFIDVKLCELTCQNQIMKSNNAGSLCIASQPPQTPLFARDALCDTCLT